METFVINTIIGFWLIVFGAMAILPFVLEGGKTTSIQSGEDVIIHIQPVATPQAPRPLAPRAISSPDQREAA